MTSIPIAEPAVPKPRGIADLPGHEDLIKRQQELEQKEKELERRERNLQVRGLWINGPFNFLVSSSGMSLKSGKVFYLIYRMKFSHLTYLDVHFRREEQCSQIIGLHFHLGSRSSPVFTTISVSKSRSISKSLCVICTTSG